MCFLRIRPEHAPLQPPGAAPTLTTIYTEDQYFSSPSTSPSPAKSPIALSSPPARASLPSAQKRQAQQRLRRGGRREEGGVEMKDMNEESGKKGAMVTESKHPEVEGKVSRRSGRIDVVRKEGKRVDEEKEVHRFVEVENARLGDGDGRAGVRAGYGEDGVRRKREAMGIGVAF